ncbi:peptidase U32 family protein [Tindallia californiensis]|uniref:Putative protease n=1 Tax=Tindallia californiensis TaxID=159292 RepID=A0A1H3NH95_9FIRM|nr:U32 family peptidase [Tindallia californiensis]SDY88218.1 putative protease [Tindallia californiensis]
MKKIELLAPAGDLERLKIAVLYGADAVYIGGQVFGLRAAAKNFSIDDMQEGVAFAHKHGVAVYLTLNIIPHNEDMDQLPDYLTSLKDINLDGVIVSDPGTFDLVQQYAPHLPIHISTQANSTNIHTVNFWHRQGATRVVMARELSLKEIKEIHQQKSPEVELESFIHGAMCISYSGRCLLSNYMIGRDANKGGCAHPCRWRYSMVEEQRPGEYMPVYEDETGTYIFHSKDLCMIRHIPQLIDAGITSLKIEGRMKTIYYVATVLRVYRQAIDAYIADPLNWTFQPEWMEELKKASHRPFTTGFYFGKPTEEDQIYDETYGKRSYDFIGLVKKWDSETNSATIQQRNRFFNGDEVELIGPNRDKALHFTINDLKNEDGEAIESAPHPQQLVTCKVPFPLYPNEILRSMTRC